MQKQCFKELLQKCFSLKVKFFSRSKNFDKKKIGLITLYFLYTDKIIGSMEAGTEKEPLRGQTVHFVHFKRIPQQRRSLCSSFVLYFPLIVLTKI